MCVMSAIGARYYSNRRYIRVVETCEWPTTNYMRSRVTGRMATRGTDSEQHMVRTAAVVTKRIRAQGSTTYTSGRIPRVSISNKNRSLTLKTDCTIYGVKSNLKQKRVRRHIILTEYISWYILVCRVVYNIYREEKTALYNFFFKEIV